MFVLILIIFITCFIFVSVSSFASGCSISLNGITQEPSDQSWPYWAEGNVTASIGFNAPENVTFYHFVSTLSVWSDSVTPQWVSIGGCSPLDFGDFSGNLPENPFEWYIGYLNDGEYKLEVALYCEYVVNTTSYNCTSDAETIFTVSEAPESNTSGSLTADFTWTPENPSIFDSMLFQSTSQVTGGYITQYLWYLDGVLISSGYESWEWSIPTEGVHTVELVIQDSNLNSDSISFSFEIGADEWFLVHAAMGKGVQQESPWDLFEQASSFEYADNIFSWVKIGNITQGMTVDFVWTDPYFSTIRSMSTFIDDPGSFGYEMWESYVVWDNISINMPMYESLFSNPGLYSVTIYVDGVPERTLDFTVASNRDLSVNLDKIHLITGEKLTISGVLTENTLPVEDSTVTIELFRKNNLLSTFSDIVLDAQGRFSQEYIIPVVDFSSDPIETWSVRVSTKSLNPDVSLVAKTVSFQVLPVKLELVEVNLVQIIETPDFTDWGGSYPYLALHRPAVLRVTLNCPSWNKDFIKPDVLVSFSLKPFVPGATIVEERSVKVTDNLTYLDISFTCGVEGSHLLEIDIDPYHEFSDPSTMQSYMQTLHWQDEIISKQMKSLHMRFIPVDIPSVLDDPSQLAFVKKQVDFIRDVYPVPKEDITFRCCYRYDTQVYEQSKWTLINMLATKNLLGNYGNSRVILVGVTPESWWDPGDEGMALGKYITSAVVVKNNSQDTGVTAHEIGHTLGLRVWTEEYDLSNYYSQRYLTGLILKDGNIVNLSLKEEYLKAFPNLNNMGRRPLSITFYCMMGNALYSWICEEDYIKLFNALKDPPNESCVLVNGWIHPDETVSVDSFYHLSTCSPDIAFDQGDYTIEVISSTGVVLYADTFGRSTVEADPFSFIIPWFDDATSIIIKKDSLVLESITPSENPPNIILEQPKGGESFDDVIQVSWRGSDADGDTITYSVFYSHDLVNWEIINIDTQETNTEIDTQYLPGGSSCVIRVIGTDGFHVDMVDSKPFSVPKKHPVCTIIDGEQLIGVGYDLEDGELSNASLTWYSDVQGFLGEGDKILMDLLYAGDHQITMKATDADGNSAQDMVEITVGEQQINGVTHVFCLDINSDGTPIDEKTVFSGDDLVYSLVTVEDAVAGDELRWMFTSPDQQIQTASLVFESSGALYGYAPIDTDSTTTDASTGVWTVDIYLNDVFVVSDSFTVSSSTESPLGIEVFILAIGILFFLMRRKQKNT